MSQLRLQASAATALSSTRTLRSVLGPVNERFLVQDVLRRLIEVGLSTEGMSIRALIWRCDRWLNSNYRNATVYRKAVVTSPEPPFNEMLFPEFRASRSIVDFLAVADVLHAVEIKSDLDDTSRIGAQLESYKRIAPLVSLVGPPRLVDRLATIPAYNEIGLYAMTGRGVIEPCRGATVAPDLLDVSTMMRSMRRVEFLAILGDHGHPLGDMPNTRIFSRALEVSQEINPLSYQQSMAAQLRRRRLRVGRNAIHSLPAPLRASMLTLNPTSEQLATIRDWLDREVRDVLA